MFPLYSDRPISGSPFITILLIIILTIVVANMFALVVGALHSSPFDDEHQEYLQIRNYSDCTKANDSACLGGCVHTYRACQIENCGKEGIGW